MIPGIVASGVQGAPVPLLVGAASHANASSTSITITVPTDASDGSFTPQAGDLLVATLGLRGALHGTAASSSGATKTIGQDMATAGGSASIWYKVLGAGETSWTWTYGSSIANVLAYFLRSSLSGGTWSVGAQQNGNGPSGTGTTVQPGSTGTLSPNAAVIATKSTNGASSSTAVDAPFTLHPQSANGTGHAALVLPSGTTALNPTFSWSAALARCAAIQTFYVT